MRTDGGLCAVACYRAGPPGGGGGAPLLVVVHEFFGLSEAICRKADALAAELECEVRARAIRAPAAGICVCVCISPRARLPRAPSRPHTPSPESLSR